MISVNGTDLLCRQEGPRGALPVVLIHGFPLSHAMWDRQVEALRPEFHVAAYDLRGLGASPAGDGQFTMETLVDDLFGLLDALELPDAVLCGMSMGGYVALRAVAREPRRVRGLVLADTRSAADDDAARLARAAAIRAVQREGLAAFADGFLARAFSSAAAAERRPCVAAAREVILRADPRGVCGAQLAMLSRTDTTPALASIRVPTLVLAGDSDEITPPESARAMTAAIPGARFAVIGGAGHMSSLENPGEFNRLLLDFLRGLPRP
ncbi:MAG: alpha/beta fold hydrolase [Elusimicrobia bacterium]|nr:alpha/beta fold hydrolase [Elusimicrobiota bacterium]